jgi:hypothetical protein
MNIEFLNLSSPNRHKKGIKAERRKIEGVYQFSKHTHTHTHTHISMKQSV